jgi:hypothetical protein
MVPLFGCYCSACQIARNKIEQSVQPSQLSDTELEQLQQSLAIVIGKIANEQRQRAKQGIK